MDRGQIYLGKRNVGRIIEGKTFRTFRDKQHYFRKYQGYGVALEVIEFLKEAGIEKIEIIDHNSNMIETYVDEVEKEGILYKHPDFETQYILRLNRIVKGYCKYEFVKRKLSNKDVYGCLFKFFTSTYFYSKTFLIFCTS